MLPLGLSLSILAAVAAAPAAWPWIAGTVLLNHVVLAAAAMTPRGRALGPNVDRLPESAARRSEVALTFDDGPDPDVTPRVLDLLDEHGARASFFLIGRRAEQHPDLASEIARRGHRLENHTYRHANTFAFYPSWSQRRDIERAQHILEDAGGRRPSYFRAPAGIRNPWLEPVLGRLGLSLASWTRRGFDTVDGDPDRVERRLLDGLAPGDILLLHDGSAARGGSGRPVVLEVLPRVLGTLAERGLRSVSMPSP